MLNIRDCEHHPAAMKAKKRAPKILFAISMYCDVIVACVVTEEYWKKEKRLDDRMRCPKHLKDWECIQDATLLFTPPDTVKNCLRNAFKSLSNQNLIYSQDLTRFIARTCKHKMYMP